MWECSLSLLKIPKSSHTQAGWTMILLKSVTFKIFFSYYHYPKPNINITMQHINGGNDVLMFLLYVDYIFLNSCNIQIRLTYVKIVL